MNRHARRLSARVLGAWLLCMATFTQADARDPAARYSRVPAGADGIGIGLGIGLGKRYMGRDIAGVMGWQGAAWLEREAAVHVLVWERTVGALPWQHPAAFRKRD